MEIQNDYEVNLEIHEYVHFETVQNRETFLFNNTHMTIAYLCCGGKGIAIKKGTKLIKQSKHTKGTCDICFIENVKLYKTCNTCIQPFCQSCLEKIVSKICPYCRGILS